MTSWLDVTAHAFNHSTREAEALDSIGSGGIENKALL